MALNERPASGTRERILQVALELFTRDGYEGASVRDLAAALGMTKSALYYHFTGKDAIVQALVEERLGELEELRDWVAAQPRDAGLLRRAALRWVDSTTPQRLQALRFAHANGPLMARLAGSRFRDWFGDIVALALPDDASMADRLVGLMALDAVGTALFAARRTEAGYKDIAAAARIAVIALTTGSLASG